MYKQTSENTIVFLLVFSYYEIHSFLLRENPSSEKKTSVE